MTNQQYRDYSEPSEREYDNIDDYVKPLSEDEIINRIASHFNTIIYQEQGAYNFVKNRLYNKEATGDLGIEILNGTVYAGGANGESFKKDIEDLNMKELLNFFEPSRKYIATGDDAKNIYDYDMNQNKRDDTYARQEKGGSY
jgi:hypothetical protein